MKLYTFAPAANALRVEMFLREKELKLETISVNVREDELFKEPYKSMNPFNCIPFLELENGTIITETISICRYLDEQNKTPKLYRNDSEERANIDMWNRRIALDGFLPVPGTRTSITQSPEIVERGIEMFDILLNRIEPHLSKNKFLLGDKFSIADITSHFMFNLSNMLKIDFVQNYKNVYRWKSDLEKRPSNPLLDND